MTSVNTRTAEDEAAEAAARALRAGGGHPAVLLFTIASVQEFVAAARRTQDLWLGSYLFSYLMYDAMKAVADRLGTDDALLLPTLSDQPLRARERGQSVSFDELLVANVPNIFTAIVPAAKAASLAGQAERAIWDTTKRVFDTVRRRIEAAVTGLASGAAGALTPWEDTWQRQRDAFLRANVFWVAVPFDSPAGYGDASREAGKLLGARKSLRSFFQTPEPGEKCTLCGLRGALAREKEAAYERVREFWNELARTDRSSTSGLKLVGRIRRGERLCAVCLTKRLALQLFLGSEIGADYHMFSSTATVATAPFVRRVIEAAAGDSGLLEAARGFASKANAFLVEHGRDYPAVAIPLVARQAGERGNALKALTEMDGQWLYRDSWASPAMLSELDLVGDNGPEGERKRSDVKAALPEVQAKLDRLLRYRRAGSQGGKEKDELALGRPSTYFAIVAVDGDKMGDLISGKRPDHPLRAQLHAEIARALHVFALRLARVAVEQHAPGRLVYAGGDDVLALLPLEGLLSALRCLRAFFWGRLLGSGPTATEREVPSVLPEGWSAEHGMVTEPAGDGGHGRTFAVPGRLGADISAAVALAHHSHPLAHAVEEAHRALKHEAKGRYNRSAVAFVVMKRSGEALTTGVKWDAGGRDMLGLLDAIAADIEQRFLSPSLAHDMRRELGAGMLEPSVQRKLLEYVLRRRPDRDEGTAVQQTVPARERVLALYDGLELLREPTDQWPRNEASLWDHVADLIEVARFMATEAGRPAPPAAEG